MGKRLGIDFYLQDVLEVAPQLLGKSIVRVFPDGPQVRYMITETEAYRGMEDRACHASKGKTKRTEVMYDRGGFLYMYLIYGMYWMLNVVTGEENNPQAVLIRGIEKFAGPGKLTSYLGIDRSYYGEDICSSPRIEIRDSDCKFTYSKTPRIGIDYSGEPWVSKKWRFLINPVLNKKFRIFGFSKINHLRH
jgi:DNA-3-methyladenine glycosylase